jgi:hypothetical protein
MVNIECMITGNTKTSIDTIFETPQGAYSAAFDYVLTKLI